MSRKRSGLGTVGGDLAIAQNLMESPIRTLTPEMLHRAALQCASYAKDTADAKDFLEMCGLFKGTEGSIEENFSTSDRSIDDSPGNDVLGTAS